jgi:hypothetical protein
MERLHNWTIGAAGVMFAALFTALVAVRWKAWMAFGIAIVAIIALGVLVAWLLLARPRLSIDNGKTEGRAFGKPPAPGIRAILHASNKPRLGAESIDHLRLILRFIDESTGRVLFSDLPGWWSSLMHRETVSYDQAIMAQPMRLPADDYAESFNVAVIFQGEEEIYALCEECQLKGSYRIAPLGPGPVILEVHARGTTSTVRIEQTKRFRLARNTDGNDLTLEPLQSTTAERTWGWNRPLPFGEGRIWKKVG